MRWLAVAGLALGGGLIGEAAGAQIVGPSTGGAAAMAQAARMLGHTKRVLMVAAHPDDEDTELLTYLVRREGAVAAYLSITRGEGGQNLIGTELGEALGLIRSEELLAARGLDGARQYFTRAFDYGYSKSLDEAFTFWPKDSLLKDVVRSVRRFRPQIIVSIFSGTARDGHGQHQAAGWAAVEAFRVAGDPTRFPELASNEGLEPWTPLKLYRTARFDTTGGRVMLEGGQLDPEIGQSYRQIAMRGRSLHRSQDMGVLQEVGPSPIRLALLEDRSGGGESLFAGIDTTARTSGVEATDLEPYRAALLAANGAVVVDAIAGAGRLVAGQSVSIRLSVWNGGIRPVEAVPGLDLPPGWQPTSRCLDRMVVVAPGTVQHCQVKVRVDPAAPPTVPYFLARPRVGAMYQWSGPSGAWGEPFDRPPAIAQFQIGAGAAGYRLEREVVHRLRDQAIGEVRRPLAVVPRVGVRATPTVKVWSTDRVTAVPVAVTLQHAGTDSTVGTVALDLPPGWPAVAPQSFRLVRPEERRTVTFLVKPPASLAPGEYHLRAVAADRDGRRYDAGTIVVAYPHIRERVYPVAGSMTVRAAPVVLPTRRRIGYVRGASDLVPEALAGVGLPVEILDPSAIERSDLTKFDAIVIGSRAYETDASLVENNGRLLDYARQGGHLVVQYQQHPFFAGGFAPFPLAVAPQHDRVTDERAPVRVLEPNDPVLRSPNPLGEADWQGWVQERGLYFPRTWDAAYRPLLEMSDPGGTPLRGGLLVAPVGKGSYVYTGLAFFRQLTAGVPGAFRLFLNLLEANPRIAVP
ncbi:MAG: NEW3 domain-containing protein [Gemmatimonadales bacterium]